MVSITTDSSLLCSSSSCGTVACSVQARGLILKLDQGLGDDTVSKMLAGQAYKPEFDFPGPMEKAVHDGREGLGTESHVLSLLS